VLLEAGEKIAEAGSWQWTPDEDDLLWSPNLFRILGLEPDEIAPSPEYLVERTHPDDRERVERRIDDLRTSGELPPLEFRIVRSDGLRYLRATLTVAESRDGRPYRMIGWVQDLTARRHADREIAAHYAVAEALNEWDGLESGGRWLLEAFASAMDSEAGVLWVPDGNALSARVQWSTRSVHLPEFQSATSAGRLVRGLGLAGRAWEAREPVGVVNMADTTHPGPREVAAVREGLRGAVAIPAIHREEVLAVIVLYSREEAQLTERLMRSLTGVGYELGRFLNRRRGSLAAPVLTAREVQVLALASQGLSTRATAEHLVISPATVKTHLENAYPKLGVSDKASAVAAALRQGLIE
jgi:PAS domain S-box-containing protein